MIPSRSFGRRSQRAHLAVILVSSLALGAATAWGQGQSLRKAPAAKLSDAEQTPQIDKADRLNRLAMALYNQRKYAEAVNPCRQALEIFGESLGQDHPYYATSLDNLGALYDAMGQTAEAESLYRRAMEIRREALGENHPEYAVTLNRLAGLYLFNWDHAKAGPLIRRALAIDKQALDENHPDHATSLNNLARLYQAMGVYTKAEPLYRQALEIYKRSQGENPLDYVASLNNLALLYKEMGDAAKAESLLRQAAEISKGTQGEDHPDYTRSLNSLASLYEAMGDDAKAESLLRPYLQTYERAAFQNLPDYGALLKNLGLLYQRMGDDKKPRELLERARSFGWGLARLQDAPNLVPTLNDLASVYMQWGQYTEAQPLYSRALDIRKKLLGENHPDYADSLHNMATVYLAQGQMAEAEEHARKGLNLATRWTQEELSALSERQRVGQLAAQVAHLNTCLSVAPAVGIQVDEIYRHVLDWKGAVEARQEEDRLARDQPELQETLGQLAQVRARLSDLSFVTPPPDKDKRDAWLQQLSELRDRKENLESDLARKSAAFRQVQQARQLGAADVAAVLPPGSVLIDLLYYHHQSPSLKIKVDDQRQPSRDRQPVRNEMRLVAFVLRPGQGPQLVPLGPAGPIDESVRSWREALVAGRPAARQIAARELRRRVWEPLEPHLEGVETVLVAADGSLLFFPLAALPGHRPGTYLVEDLAIGYVSSAHRLAGTLATPGEAKATKPEPSAAGLLAIGGIDYQADAGRAAPSESAPTSPVLLADSLRAAFHALAGTEPEVRRIAELFGAAFPQQRALVLTGAAPTESAVKQLLGRRWRHLHLATHGFFESPARVARLRAGQSPNGSGLIDPQSSKEEESASLALTPLLHSGVALAGAARKAEDVWSSAQGNSPDREDGILTAEDVQSLDLRGMEMVVLSACETGLGQRYDGQGVMGLQRAFQAARLAPSWPACGGWVTRPPPC
jgi:tetratricopeptide (TPR) repeat protein